MQLAGLRLCAVSRFPRFRTKLMAMHGTHETDGCPISVNDDDANCRWGPIFLSNKWPQAPSPEHRTHEYAGRSEGLLLNTVYFRLPSFTRERGHVMLLLSQPELNPRANSRYTPSCKKKSWFGHRFRFNRSRLLLCRGQGSHKR